MEVGGLQKHTVEEHCLAAVGSFPERTGFAIISRKPSFKPRSASRTLTMRGLASSNMVFLDEANVILYAFS
jgi:hypothetical protein